MKALIIQTIDSLSEGLNNKPPDILDILLFITIAFMILAIFLIIVININKSRIKYYEIFYSLPGEYETVLVKAKSYEIEEIEKGNGSISSNYISIYKIETIYGEKLIIPKEKIFDVTTIYKENVSTKIKQSPHIIK